MIKSFGLRSIAIKYLKSLKKLQYLQLAILSEQVCLSRGYSFRFMGQDSVSEILMLYSTLPLGKIRMYTFGIMMLWKWPSFSLEKNRSGIHTLLASVSVRYLRRPGSLSKWGRGKVEFWRLKSELYNKHRLILFIKNHYVIKVFYSYFYDFWIVQLFILYNIRLYNKLSVCV